MLRQSPASAEPSTACGARLRPMARVDRVTLFEREVRERLSSSAVEILLDHAEVLLEGRRVRHPERGERFFGTALLTIRLAALSHLVREPPDPGCARRVAAQMGGDERVHDRVRRLARAELLRHLGQLDSEPEMEIRVRSEGAEVYVDADVEVALERAAAQAGG